MGYILPTTLHYFLDGITDFLLLCVLADFLLIPIVIFSSCNVASYVRLMSGG